MYLSSDWGLDELLPEKSFTRTGVEEAVWGRWKDVERAAENRKGWDLRIVRACGGSLGIKIFVAVDVKI